MAIPLWLVLGMSLICHAAAQSPSTTLSPEATSTPSTTDGATAIPIGVATILPSGTVAADPAVSLISTSGILPGGAIAGIAIGAVAGGAALLALIGFFFWNRGVSSRHDRYRHKWMTHDRDVEGQDPVHGPPMSLNPESLDQHLAGQEWAGMRQNAPQKQTAFHREQQPQHDSLSDLSDIKPEGVVGESRHGSDAAADALSDETRTVPHPTSETVHQPKA